MRIVFALAGFTLAMTMGAGAAQACRVPRPPLFPINAARTAYDAIALAEVVSRDANGAQVRYVATFDGRLDRTAGRIAWGLDPDGPPNWVVVTCGGGPGPQLQPGDRAVVILARTSIGLYPAGWMRLEDAAERDEYFALYLAATQPAERRRLQRRWRLVNHFGGPVPVGDPTRWLAPHDGRPGLGTWSEGATTAQFEVDPRGRVTACTAGQAGGYASRDDPLCVRLGRHRFHPPIFARERRGYYQVRWSTPAAQ